MARISYVNGQYLHHSESFVHIEDRGYQFSDGLYEYFAFYNRTLLDGDLHFKRLERSVKELEIAMPVSIAAMKILIRELIERNGREDGGLYLQITRGVAKRDHAFPKNTKPALVMTICAAKTPKESDVKNGVHVITAPDIRWARRDIKSVSLLGNVLAKQQAALVHAREAWLIDGGVITEGSASNSYIIDDKGTLITHPATHKILGGITRDVVITLARANNIAVSERSFTLDEAKNAREAFITSSSANVLPVVKIDDTTVGSGKVGSVTMQLQALYAEHIFQQTGKQF
jgi:D-alanine transaminase